MTRAGLFDQVDVALHWHADSKNSASVRPALANKIRQISFLWGFCACRWGS
jgi:aminobenzoyl-glutamate utilization protein B